MSTLLKFCVLYGASCIICGLFFYTSSNMDLEISASNSNFPVQICFYLFIFSRYCHVLLFIKFCMDLLRVLMKYFKCEPLVKSTVILTLSCVNVNCLERGIQNLLNVISYMGNCFLLFKHIYKCTKF